ncbi:cytochrome c [Pragia fontium]|uniref:Cytochrome c n=1 Tax=Pragia fontium TaxID=82985 RepID=A0ABQ5LJJ4_9GAMM|nr:c-type cytochrome [Pragia fontium]GKX62708.1 cytochrome c [Pragia fontium]
MSNYMNALYGLLLLLFAQVTIADVNITLGQEIAQNGTAEGVPACASCHGEAGQGNNSVGFPRLAALPTPYILQQLNDLADSARHNSMMSPVAGLLTPQQKRALADYYASLPVVMQTPASPTQENSMQRAGKAIATVGKLSQNLPACDRCHGVNGAGVGEQFPPLAGQSAIYLENQLLSWKNGDRPAGALDLMPGIASQLSPQQIKEIAHYYSRLSQPIMTQSTHQGEKP